MLVGSEDRLYSCLMGGLTAGEIRVLGFLQDTGVYFTTSQALYNTTVVHIPPVMCGTCYTGVQIIIGMCWTTLGGCPRQLELSFCSLCLHALHVPTTFWLLIDYSAATKVYQ